MAEGKKPAFGGYSISFKGCSRTSALAASTRYIVRIEQGGTWPASSTWAQICAGGRSTNRSSCNSVNMAVRSDAVRACRGACRARGPVAADGGPPRRR